ncbi:MAG: hypothetical protein L3K23_04590 [Thermoplasmata archaeon]|nr:hypothetical protein [Thermoplasmata archaeon]
MTATHRVLREELACFERESDRLLVTHAGQFVLICGSRVAGVYATEAEAIRAGYEAFGPVAFLVRCLRPGVDRLRLDELGRSS